MITSEKVDQIIPALFEFHSKVPKIDKNANNPFTNSDYSSFDHIMDVIRPYLLENQLFIMQTPEGKADELTVKTRLWHKSGQWMESPGCTVKPQKIDPQGSGGAITYAKRYDLCAFLGLNTGDDDDGNVASGRTNKSQSKSTQQKKHTPKSNPDQPAAAKKPDVEKFLRQAEELAGLKQTDIIQVLQVFQLKQKNDAYRLSEKAIKQYHKNMENFIQKAKNEKSA